jgi:DNA-binding transcriptional regulator LsrR (DeoR family)
MGIILRDPGITQEEIGKKLGIKQSGVSGRWNRANADEILTIIQVFRNKIKKRLL